MYLTGYGGIKPAAITDSTAVNYVSQDKANQPASVIVHVQARKKKEGSDIDKHPSSEVKAFLLAGGEKNRMLGYDGGKEREPARRVKGKKGQIHCCGKKRQFLDGIRTNAEKGGIIHLVAPNEKRSHQRHGGPIFPTLLSSITPPEKREKGGENGLPGTSIQRREERSNIICASRKGMTAQWKKRKRAFRLHFNLDSRAKFGDASGSRLPGEAIVTTPARSAREKNPLSPRSPLFCADRSQPVPLAFAANRERGKR